MNQPVSTDPVTSDHLLGGQVAYTQPRDGFRAAIDPVLLAAAVPAKAGERVLEGGTGAGAAMLCLAARVPDIFGVGVDRDPGLLRLAQANAAANARSGLLFAAGDLAASPIAGEFDHAFANPPYHAAEGTPSPSTAREAAKRSAPRQLSVWVDALSRPLRHRGTLTLILPPRMLEQALTAMQDGNIPAECVFPIWPRRRRGGSAPAARTQARALAVGPGVWPGAAYGNRRISTRGRPHPTSRRRITADRRLIGAPAVPTSVLVGVRMAQMPKTLMRRDQTLHIASPGAVGGQRPPGQHHLQDVEQLFRHLKVTLIAGMVEGDQDLVRQAPAIARRSSWTRLSTDFLVSLAHPGPRVCSFG